MNWPAAAGVALGGIAVIFLFFRVFSAPLKLFLKLVINTALGFAMLLLLNFFGKYIGVTLGVNLINAVTAGILGVPGIALLLLLKWMFT